MKKPKEFRENLKQLGTTLSSPIGVELEVTSNCNHCCQFCYNVWQKGQFPEADMFFILDRLREADVKVLFLTGGEPFLRKDIFQLIEYSVQNKMKINAVTNGTLLTEKKARRLKELGVSVQVSLHGTEQTHNYLVGVPGAYKKAMQGLAYLRECKVPLSINITLTRYNFSEIPHVGVIARSLNARLSMTRLVLTGTDINKSLQFTKETIFELIDFLAEHPDLKGSSILSPFPLCCLGEEGIPKMLKIYDMYDVVGCQGGITWCAVSPEGKVRICGAMEEEAGDLKIDDLRTIWKSKSIWKCRTFAHVHQVCLECEYLSVCNGGCRADAYALSGSMSAPDPLATY